MLAAMLAVYTETEGRHMHHSHHCGAAMAHTSTYMSLVRSRPLAARRRPSTGNTGIGIHVPCSHRLSYSHRLIYILLASYCLLLNTYCLLGIPARVLHHVDGQLVSRCILHC